MNCSKSPLLKNSPLNFSVNEGPWDKSMELEVRLPKAPADGSLTCAVPVL